MRPTVAQLSGRNSARSSRFAKSVASTIATSAGRPDPAESVRHDRARPSVRLLAAPTLSSAAFVRGSRWPQSGWLPCVRPVVYSLLAFLGLSGQHRPSSTEWDEVLAKDRSFGRLLAGTTNPVSVVTPAGSDRIWTPEFQGVVETR